MSTHPFWRYRYRDEDFRPIVTSSEDGQSVVQYSIDNEVGQMAPMPTNSRFIQNILSQLAADPLIVEDPEVELEDVPAGDLVERVQEFLDDPDSQLVFAQDEADAPTGRDILESLMPHTLQRKMLLTVESSDGSVTYYTLNERNVATLRTMLEEDIIVPDTPIGSDAELLDILRRTPQRVTVRHLRSRSNARELTRPGGMFFRWNIRADVEPLLLDTCRRLGIFTKSEQREQYALGREDTRIENCLVRALREAGLPVSKLQQLRHMCRNRFIPIYRLKDFAASLKIQIKLQREAPKGGTMVKKTQTIGKDGDPLYTIACVDEHFFAVVDTGVTSYAIRNYAAVRRENDWQHIVHRYPSGKYQRKRNRTVDSYALVRLLLANKDEMLTPVVFGPELCATAFYDRVKDIASLEYDPDLCVREVRGRAGRKLSDKKEAEYVEDIARVFKTREMDELEFVDKWARTRTADMTERFRNSGPEWANAVAELESRRKCRVFYDFETYARTVTRRGGRRRVHTPFLVCADVEGHGTLTYAGPDCARQLLERLAYIRTYRKRRGGYIMIAHNSQFDFRFMAGHVHVKDYNPFGGFLQARARYYPMTAANQHVDLDFKCSYKIIPMPLGRFGACFGMEQEKEVMPYTLYSAETLAQGWVPVESARDHLHKSHEYDQFKSNVERWGLGDGTDFDLRAYARRYCELDVQVLKHGYLTFRGWIRDAFDIDIDDVLTIPSLADKMQKARQVYEGVNEVSNVPRAFLQKFVCGGRVMVGNSERRHLKGEPVSDYDCTSLYPSAMARLTSDLGGYLKGRPKVIGPDQLNMDFLRTVDGYFVEVVCTKVGKHREFPLLNHRETPQSTRQYRNDLAGKTLFLDRVGLEDAVRFQGLEFDLVRGYYFDEGRNPTIGTVIREMFDARVEKKRVGNPIQIVYKLLMNASYGRTLLKPVETTADVYNTEAAYEKQLIYNYNSVKSVQPIPGGKFLVTKWAPIDKHFNTVHVGCEVLSMSKRIMSEVMCLAEDLGMRIDYTDTDSIHIPARHLPELERVYRETYGRELEGKNLGQFHTDFDVHEPLLDRDGRRMGSGAGIKCTSIDAVESLFLGKKCYVDKLRGIRKDTGEAVTDYHLRMKGVPTQSIWHRLHTRPEEAPETEPEGFADPVALYRHLYDGHELSFDLTCGHTKASFDMTRGFDIIDRPAFVRRVSFTSGQQVSYFTVTDF